MRHGRPILALPLLVLLAITKPSIAQDYSFGIVPQQAAQTLAAKWTPIFNFISQESGYQIRFSTAKDIPTFEQRLSAGEYDFAYMNPYHYTVFSQKPGYVALARRKDQGLQGILVVAKDSPIQSIRELNNQTLAFPSPAAFAASVVPRAVLKAQGIKIKPQYVSSHDSVYLSVSKNLFPAGGGVKRTFNNTDAQVRHQLRVLWETKAYTPHAIAVHPNIPTEVREKVLVALLKLNETAEGKQLLNSISVEYGIIAAQDSDWDDVRALKIDLLDHLLK